MMNFVLRSVLLLLVHCTAAISAEEVPTPELLAGWVALDAPTGHEHHATGAIASALPGWTADRMGNLSRTLGSGPDLQVVACLLDAPAMTVSEIRGDGYLRLHMIGRPEVSPLWAQAHEGQQLRVLTATGPVIGVTALANGHFMNLHRDEDDLTRVDDLWLDVGASSAAEVAELGIGLLDPVLRHLPPWHFDGWVAGPAAGARMGCATVVAAAQAGISGRGRVRYVLTTQSAFGGIGLSAALADEEVTKVVLLGAGIEADDPEGDFVSPVREGFAAFDLAKLEVIRPEVVEAGTLVERVHRDEVLRLADAMLAALGVEPRPLAWTAAPSRARPVRARAADADEPPGIPEFAASLAHLGERYAVSGHESPVRAAVLAALPAWARSVAATDEMGNLWLDLGPRDREATVFMAHMDEVGWQVAAIHDDGTVDLERQGGSLALAREGQPALLQLSTAEGADAETDPRMLRGVFLSRANPEARWPENLRAWFGLDGADLKSAGVSVGMPVTGYKEAHRLGRHRFTVRSMDDRVGTAALLAAVRRLDPDALEHRVIFAWSVQEEVGLHGARALAARFAAQTRRIYSIDTFVTSDTPLESSHFAFTPLGRGPVLRSMENSGLVRPEELARNRAIAAAAGIAVQVGMTQGGTDGTAFTFYGAPNAGLSWPGRYSHGPAELGDLRDMVKLVDLIEAFALAAP